MPSDGLGPAEDLFDSLPYPLATLASVMTKRALIDGRTCRTLRYMWRCVQLLQPLYARHAVIAFVQPDGDSVRSPQLSDHVDGCLAFRGSAAERQPGVNDQTVAILQQHVPVIGQLGFCSSTLLWEPLETALHWSVPLFGINPFC